jgi:hypothetical protein
MVGIFLIYGGGVLSFLRRQDASTSRQIIGWTLALLGLALLFFATYRRQIERAALYERREQRAKEGVDEAIGQLRDVTDLPALIRINRQQMEQYEELTRRQANSSYRLSQGALGIGLALLAAGSIAALVTPESSSKAVVGALTAIGSVVAGFISNTYLRVYERTLVQLNFYFQQPLVTSYVLTAERLADKMTGSQRDDAQKQIIDRVLATIGPMSEDGTTEDRP